MRQSTYNCWSKHLTWIRDVKRSQGDFIPIRGSSALIPIDEDDGAILIWMFDNNPGTHHYLVVRLSEREADLVNAGDPYNVGLLEPVRWRIRNRWALLMVKCGNKIHTTPYRIPRLRPEGAFIAALDRAAATCPVYRVSNSREIARDVQMFAEDMARDLALA